MGSGRARVATLTLTTVLGALLLLAAGVPARGAQGATPTPVAGESFPLDETVVVRAYFTERAQVDALAGWTEPWDVSHERGVLVVELSPEEQVRALALGFRLELDIELSRELDRPRLAIPGQRGGIPGFACYRTVEETFASAQQLATDHPTLARWIDVGDSWDRSQGAGGYDMNVLVLTNRARPGPKPILFITSSIHAREYAPAELVTRFGEYLVDNYGIDADATWLLDHHEIHLMPQANPDARKKAEAGQWWRKNVNNNFCANTSSRGVDLNRNFSFGWACCGGSSGFECSDTFRGPGGGSEPEVAAIEQYLTTIFPDQRGDPVNEPAPDDATGIYLDIHSYSELVLWPWGFNGTTGNDTQFQTFGRKLAYFNGYEPQQAVDLYVTDGTTMDFGYGELGVASLVYELGTAFFQSCSTFESIVLPDNLASLLYAARVARSPYRTPAGPDALDLLLSASTVQRGDPVTLTARIDDMRYENRNGIEPSQPIAGADLFVDLAPWEPGATPLSMTPADGSWNALVESATATLDTTTLAPGRHILFVRGEDAAGNQGAVSAIFLDVVDYPITPTPSATPTASPSPTPTVTATPTPGHLMRLPLLTR